MKVEGKCRRRGMPDDPETFKLLYKHTQTHIFGLKDYVRMENVCLAKSLSAPNKLWNGKQRNIWFLIMICHNWVGLLMVIYVGGNFRRYEQYVAILFIYCTKLK